MKSQVLIVVCAATLAGLVGSGCKSHTTTSPVGGGYEEVTHSSHSFLSMGETPPPRISFQFHPEDKDKNEDADKHIIEVWPSLYDVNVVIKDDLAIFIAEKAVTAPERKTLPRLFAVRAPQLPLNLTDEVLWRWSKANGKKFNATLAQFAGISVDRSGGGLLVNIDFWPKSDYAAERDDWPDKGTVQLDWHQVEELIRAVKSKGVVEADVRWHTRYIEEKY